MFMVADFARMALLGVGNKAEHNQTTEHPHR